MKPSNKPNRKFGDLTLDLRHDLAMIVVSEPFVYNINVKPACLPKFPIKPGNICYATGLGKTKDIQFLAIDSIITQQKFPESVETVDLVIHDLEQCYNSHMQTNVSTYFSNSKTISPTKLTNFTKNTNCAECENYGNLHTCSHSFVAEISWKQRFY